MLAIKIKYLGSGLRKFRLRAPGSRTLFGSNLIICITIPSDTTGARSLAPGSGKWALGSFLGIFISGAYRSPEPVGAWS